MLILAAYFRLLGLDWDEGHLLHPDERFLVMVEGALGWPSSFSSYFNTTTSPLNPHNRNFSFFVYGTLPLFIIKALSVLGAQATEIPAHMYGRSFSATCDLGTVLLVFLMARTLFSQRVALFTMFLISCSVLHIQHSHFGVVDGPLTFFVTLSLALAMILSRYHGAIRVAPIALSIAFGVTAGCAASTKITGALVAIVLPCALLMRSRSTRDFLVYSTISGITTLLTFRTFQPYAFSGPGFFDVSLNPLWIKNLKEISSQAQPSLYFPPAVQWFNRGSLFGLKNLCFWGFGVLPSLAALAGIVIGWKRVLFQQQKELLIFLVWASAGLIVFGLRPAVVSLRYLLPLYPALFMLAGGAMDVLEKQSYRRVFLRKIPLMLMFLVATYGLVWALAFVQIYRKPHSRVAASEWILTTVPGAVQLLGSTVSGYTSLPVAVASEGDTIITPSIPLTIPFSVIEKMSLTGVSLPKISLISEPTSTDTSPSPQIKAYISPIAACASGQSGASLDENTALVPLRCTLAPGKQYQLTIKVEGSNARLAIKKQVIAHETSWDDGLPIRVWGYDPFGGIYSGKPNFELYWNDDEEKRNRIISILKESDYIFITSNRQWGSIGRLQQHYPLTQRFYRGLLACDASSSVFDCYATAEAPKLGSLGFELIKTETSYPHLFGVPINDQYAEEAFSVYDHPKVMLFKKQKVIPEDELRTLL